MVTNEHNFKPFYYNALKLKPGAEIKEIEAAYTLCRNKVGRDPSYRYRESQLLEAYKVLSKTGSRAMYDIWLEDFLEAHHGIQAETGKVEITSTSGPETEASPKRKQFFIAILVISLLAGAWQFLEFWKLRPKTFSPGDIIVRPGTEERYEVLDRNAHHRFYTGATGDAYRLINTRTHQEVWYSSKSVGRSFEVDTAFNTPKKKSTKPEPPAAEPKGTLDEVDGVPEEESSNGEPEGDEKPEASDF